MLSQLVLPVPGGLCAITQHVTLCFAASRVDCSCAEKMINLREGQIAPVLSNGPTNSFQSQYNYCKSLPVHSFYSVYIVICDISERASLHSVNIQVVRMSLYNIFKALSLQNL